MLLPTHVNVAFTKNIVSLLKSHKHIFQNGQPLEMVFSIRCNNELLCNYFNSPIVDKDVEIGNKTPIQLGATTYSLENA